ncbi:methyl-accepting chemotaxis protein [Fundidesulfovibrio soli]|uniref:methyl-accepting chemotaxis protein n=1 Tax=Fundidesulfovibrio soli TaxID=2922716 RepID=UPI001FAFB264|nr:methyl-accepting chemotaxis protein [Fundidesulfovibrio soli]
MKLSLQLKFLIPALGAILLGMLCLVVLNANLVRSSMETMLGQDTALLAQFLSRDVTGGVEDRLHALAGIAKRQDMIQAAEGKNPPGTHEELLSLVNSLKGLLYLNVFDLKGEALTSSEVLKGSVNVADRDYFKAVSSGKDRAVSKPLVSRTVGKAVVVLAVAVKDGSGKLVGVLNAGLDLEYLTSEVGKTRIGDSGYAFILDRDGMYVAHPDTAKRMQTEKDPPEWMRKALAASSMEKIATSQDGNKGMVTVLPDPLTGWRYVIVSPYQEMAALVQAVNRNNMLISLVIAVLLVAVIMASLRVCILKPLSACGAFAREVAGGSLDARLEVHGTDQLGVLADDLRKMVDSLKANLETIREEGRRAEDAVHEAKQALGQAEQARHEAEEARREGMLQAAGILHGVVGGITESSEALMAEIDALRNGVAGQEATTGETAAAMDEMNSSVLEVARNAAEASELADKTRVQAQSGHDVVENARKAINEVDGLAKVLEQGMAKLGQQATAIGQVMTVISDIADQTNLLALNAAIEAARAGDAGRGFAVVADEVRKLAEKTMDSTKEVGQAIANIQANTADNVQLVKKAAQAVAVAAGLADQSGEALALIVGLVDQSSGQVRGIAQAAGQQSSVSEEIARAVSDISSFSQNLAQGVGEFARAVQGLSGHAHELKAVIADLEESKAGGARAIGV